MPVKAEIESHEIEENIIADKPIAPIEQVSNKDMPSADKGEEVKPAGSAFVEKQLVFQSKPKIPRSPVHDKEPVYKQPPDGQSQKPSIGEKRKSNVVRKTKKKSIA